MPHPIMFRDDDPGLAQLRRIALGFPEAFEKISHGRPVFCAPKMFAIYGGNSKATGAMVPYPHALLVKVDDSERQRTTEEIARARPAVLLADVSGPVRLAGTGFRCS